MYEHLYSFGQSPQPSQHCQPLVHPQDQEFKLIDRSLSQESSYPSSSMSCLNASPGSMPGTLPTIPLLSHHQHTASFPSQLHVQPVMKLPEHQNSLLSPQFMDNFHNMRPGSSTTLGHTFDEFQPMESSQDIVASFGYGVPSLRTIYEPVDMNSLVHSPTTSMPDLPNTLPPLNSGALHTPPPDHQTLPQAHRLACQEDRGAEHAPAKKVHVRPRVSRERAPWTPEEDNLLRLAVQLYGDKTEKWAKIAECVPGRTNKNCRKRWFHSLDPSLRKGAWTEEEDQLLREGVMKYPNQWSKIADMLDGRTDDQCAKRWRESLDPSIDRSEWTADEDARLMEKYEEFGSQWQKIAQFFEGRPGLHCRNRWRKLQRMSQMKKEKEAAALATLPSAAQLVNDLGDESLGSLPQTTRILDHHMTHNKPNHTAHQSDTSSLTSHGSAPSSSPSTHSLTNMIPQPQFGATADEKVDPHSDLSPYGCDIPGCLASFSQSSGLFYHMKSMHPNMEGYDKPFRCAMPNCTKRYKNINGLQYHIREAKGASGHGALYGKIRKPVVTPPSSDTRTH